MLKLLSFDPTELSSKPRLAGYRLRLAGLRDWDCRSTLIRDASFTLYNPLRIGITEETIGFRTG